MEASNGRVLAVLRAFMLDKYSYEFYSLTFGVNLALQDLQLLAEWTGDATLRKGSAISRPVQVDQKKLILLK